MNDDIQDLMTLRSQLEGQVIELLRLRDKLTADMREVIRYTSRAMAAVEHGEAPDAPGALPPLGFAAPALEGDAEGPELVLRLDVGPLPSFSVVSSLENELVALAGVRDVYVMRYDGTQAAIEVALAGAAREHFTAWIEERFQVEELSEDHFVLYGIRTADHTA